MNAPGGNANTHELRIALREAAPLQALARSIGSIPDLPEGTEESVALSDHFRLLHRLSVMGRDETCHLSLRPLTLGTTDFVVETLDGAADLEDAMRRVAKAYNLIHGGTYNRVERRRDRLIYAIDDRDFPYAFDTTTGLSHGIMEGVLIFLHAMLCCAVAGDLVAALRTVRSRRPERVKPDGLLAFWCTPVRCNAPVYALEYDLPAAGLAIRDDVADSARVGAVYEKALELIAAREHGIAPADFTQRVINAIASGSTEQPRVARRLGVSVATLRRRLNGSSRCFRDLRVEVLNQTARLLLEQRRHTAEVAETLGFADVRSFARAFKSWNGVTPAAFAARRSEPLADSRQHA